MSLKKDKEKVIDPVWDESRIREFLELQPTSGENADFHRLLKAYQSMRVEDFEQFVEFFKEAGGDIRATNQRQETVHQVIASHRHSAPYQAALES